MDLKVSLYHVNNTSYKVTYDKHATYRLKYKLTLQSFLIGMSVSSVINDDIKNKVYSYVF